MTTTTEKYHITGMSCQGCANSIERTVSKIAGIDACSVSFATESMTITRIQADKQTVVQAVTDLGFGIAAADDKKKM